MLSHNYTFLNVFWEENYKHSFSGFDPIPSPTSHLSNFFTHIWTSWHTGPACYSWSTACPCPHTWTWVPNVFSPVLSGKPIFLYQQGTLKVFLTNLYMIWVFQNILCISFHFSLFTSQIKDIWSFLCVCVCVCVCVRVCSPVHLVTQSHVRLFATSWTVACQTPLSMGFSRQEYWSG